MKKYHNITYHKIKLRNSTNFEQSKKVIASNDFIFTSDSDNLI